MTPDALMSAQNAIPPIGRGPYVGGYVHRAFVPLNLDTKLGAFLPPFPLDVWTF